MKYDYKVNSLIVKTFLPILILWTITISMIYKDMKKDKSIFSILFFPYLYIIISILGVLNDKDGQGLVIDRESCYEVDDEIDEDLRKKGFVGVFKPQCRASQQMTQFGEAQNVNDNMNYVLNILFLLILIFISTKSNASNYYHILSNKIVCIIVFYILLGTLASTGFITFPWRAIIFTRISLCLSLCTSTLLTLLILILFYRV